MPEAKTFQLDDEEMAQAVGEYLYGRGELPDDLLEGVVNMTKVNDDWVITVIPSELYDAQ